VETHVQSIRVAFDYPVVFTRGLFAADHPALIDALDRLGERRRHRVWAVLDDGVDRTHSDLHDRLRTYADTHPTRMDLAGLTVVGGGEAAKNGWDVVRQVMATIGQSRMDRQSVVLAIGGGAVLDMVGFAASIVHRGLRLVRVPTTTIAQGDGGVGVKTGMDEHGQKNFVGTFAPPFAVLNDSDFLPTLAPRDWIGGVAEAFKVAIIKDAAFFEFLLASADALRQRDLQAMTETVRHCALLHLEHLRAGGDPFEMGSARPLDFGHWVGHRLETASDYRLGHGQAVAIGIAVDSAYACRRGLLGAADLRRILDGLTGCGLPIWDALLAARSADGRLDVLVGLEQFHEHLGGQLTITLPNGLGGKTEVHHVDTDLVEQVIDDLAEVGDA